MPAHNTDEAEHRARRETEGERQRDAESETEKITRRQRNGGASFTG